MLNQNGEKIVQIEKNGEAASAGARCQTKWQMNPEQFQLLIHQLRLEKKRRTSMDEEISINVLGHHRTMGTYAWEICEQSEHKLSSQSALVSLCGEALERQPEAAAYVSV